MSNWIKTAKELKSGHDKYKAIQGKIDNIEGKVSDIRKLHKFASNLIHHRAGSSSELLKISYEGITRLSALLPTPYLSHYLKFYQVGINSMSQLWKIEDESKLVLDWSKELHKSATEFEDGIDAILSEYSYAGAMVDSNGEPSINLPPGLKTFFKRWEEFETSWNDVGNSIANVDWNKKMQAIEAISFHLEYAVGQQTYLLQRKQSISQGIIHQARIIAAAYVHFANTYSKVISAGNKANKTLQRLTSSNNPAEFIGGKGTENFINWDIAEREIEAVRKRGKAAPGIGIQDTIEISSGNWQQTSDYKKMHRAMNNMRNLANDWSLWASWTAKGKIFALV